MGFARNVIFKNAYSEFRLKRHIRKYLSPISDIISIVVHRDQFQLIVKMKQREQFVAHYTDKKKRQNKEIGSIPESTYIFSQAMANLQSSIAIHFNRKENRTGAVFARRFAKIIIKNERELEIWKKRLREKIKLHYYQGKWGVDRVNGVAGSCIENGFRRLKFSKNFHRLQGRFKNNLKFVSFLEFLAYSPP